VAELKPVYLLTGSDRPKVETAVGRLRRRFVPEAVERISAIELSGDEAVALANAGTLFGDSRLVLVEDVDGRRTSEGRLTGGWKAADAGAVAAYLEAPAPGTVLALVGEEVRKDSPLAKACAKAGEVLQYDVVKRHLAAWVADRFRQLGVEAEPDACAALLQLVGDDPVALAAEVDKIATWAAGEPVGEREVEQLVAASADTPSFALTDAWSKRDVARALAVTEEIFEREGRPRRDVAPRLAAALGSYVGKLTTAKRLAAEGVRPADALGRLGTRSRFYAEKLYTQAESFSAEELRDATLRLAKLDLALKGDSRLAPDLELQRAVLELGRPSDGAPGRAA
jgi:DNA polymerase III delta subunit